MLGFFVSKDEAMIMPSTKKIFLAQVKLHQTVPIGGLITLSQRVLKTGVLIEFNYRAE